ncbi:MAG: fumarylacetoacetate hydrolase family protein [Gammaproteobacteria bacterium]|nr:MAG: fumarylacetoacetate hydrolase family protein [Gammaproteobacteria bacterium]
MKLATFSTTDNQNPRLGAVRDDGIADLGGADGVPDTLLGLLNAGDAAMAAARSAADTADAIVPLDQVTLHPPVLTPGKILAIGLNYGDHIEESGMGKPKHQVWFNKQHNCVNGPYADIALPSVSGMLDYEAELVVVIGKRCKHVPRERAAEVIAGYCCGNDVSVRDWQMRAQTMQIGKSFDTHGPTGPWLVTPDEVGDPHNLDIRAEVNGDLRQNSNTRHLIYDCYDAVAHLTQAFTLDPGDLLFMGTPAGVGAAMKPPQFLKAGDVVKVEIEKLGYLENRVVPEAAECVIE